MAAISKIRAEFDARQATEAMYALSERARFLNKLLTEQRKRWEETGDPKIKETQEASIRRLETELAAVEKLNRTIEKSISTESAFQQVLENKTSSMSVARLESAQRNARAIMRNINPQDENAIDQMDEAQRVMNTAGKQLASLKNGFTDAMQTVADGVAGKALPELKRLETALTEAQKFSVDQAEWNKYQEAIGKVRLEIQAAGVASVHMEEQNAKMAASLKYGFEDAFETFDHGIDGMALPELKRLEAALTETQKFSVNSEEWQKYGTAIDTVRQKVQGITGEYLSVKDAMGYAEQIGRQTFTGTIADLERAKKLLTDYRRTIKQTGEGAAELKKVDENLEIIEQQIKGTYLTTEKFNEILTTPKGKSFDELKAAIEKAEKQLYGMRRETDEEREAFVKLHEQIEGAKEELKDFGEAQEDTSNGMEELTAKAKQLAGAYLGLQSFQKVWEMNLELSDQMAAVRKTTGMTEEQVARLNESIKAIDTRATNEQLMSLAATAGQLGLQTAEDVLGFTKAANQITVSLDELGNDGVLQLMKVAEVSGALANEGGDVEQTLLKVGSAINELSAASSATAGPITDFIGRVGGVASTAKMSMAQIAALGATTDALAISAELAGTQINVFIGGMQKNTKAVADLLDVSKDYVQSMFDNGQAMDLFVQTMEKMNTLNANELDKFLKEMGSSGSRATQVFSTLSQHVDQLRANLEVSNEAYSDGISITEEYNKVNDTAAGKFERLKNQIQEAFVSDSVQKSLGWMIDRLRDIVNLLTGNVSPALDLVGILLKTLLIRWAIVKAEIGKALIISLPKAIVSLRALTVTAFTTMGTQIKAAAFYMGMHTMATKRAAVAMRQMNAAQLANFWVALAAAIAYAAKALYDWSQRVSKTVSAMTEAESKLAETTREAGNLFGQYKKLSERQEELAKSTKNLKEREAKLKEEMESLRKTMGEGAEKSDEYKRKQEELEEAHKEVAKAEGEASKATNERLGLINEINSKYSTYLGYMLSEASTAETVASAHNLIIAALKEEMYWREKNNAFKTVTEQHSEDLNKYIKKSLAEMNGIDETRQQNIMSAWQAQLSQVTYDASKGGFTLTPGGRAYATIDQALEGMKERFNTVLVTEGGYYMVHTNDKQDRLNDWWGGGLDDGFKNWTEESLKVLKEASMLQSMSGSAATKAHEAVVREAQTNTDALIQQASQEGATNRQMAEAVVGIQKNLSKYGELAGNYQQFAADTSLQGIANVLLKDLPADTRKAVEAEMQRVAANGLTPTTPTTPTNPRGTPQPGESTAYTEMTAEQLVNRRKQMKDFVNSIQTDTDVKAVLNEDKALKKAIENGMSSDMRTVIEWYNTERLKIQDELHARHLTNTGDWLDPEKVRKRVGRVVNDEMKYYLDELDAYYTERKAKIQEAQNDGEISEAEAQNRILANDAEWQQRRGELQLLYSRRAQKVVEQERQAIFDIISERTGETQEYIKADIAQTNQLIIETGKKNRAAMDRIYGDIELKAEQSFLRQRNAIGKHLTAIQTIIDKENPYTGITETLRKELATMDVLLADIKDEQQRTVDKETERTMFILEQSARGYALTWEQMMADMAKRGWEAWAKAIEADPQMQERLMHQTYKVFEKVQDAIKKEASELKKQADIMWSNLLMPGGDGKTTIKDAFEQAVSALGIEQGRVSRANSLIGAGQASERVADRLAIKQMQVQLAMLRYQYDLVHKIGKEKIDSLRREAEADEALGNIESARAKRMQAQNAEMALNLATRKEQTEEMKVQEEIIARTEESQNRLYTSLREWADLLSSSVQSLFEATHAGDAEYYNERAKLDLTGKGGPGAGTYVVIDDAGTSDARAHYEYLDERQALEREHEIERENAQAEAWRKVMDDLNAKMNEQITDWMNAALQNQSIDANTKNLDLNTKALEGLTEQLAKGIKLEQQTTPDVTKSAVEIAKESAKNITGTPRRKGVKIDPHDNSTWGYAARKREGLPAVDTNEPDSMPAPSMPQENSVVSGELERNTQALHDLTQALGISMTEEKEKKEKFEAPEYDKNDPDTWGRAERKRAGYRVDEGSTPDEMSVDPMAAAQLQIDADNLVTENKIQNDQKKVKSEQQTDKQMANSSQSAFAKMTAAANLYGIAYQTMSNDNLSTSEKFQMFALQAAGQAAIGMLTTNLFQEEANNMVRMPGILGKLLGEMPYPAAIATYAAVTALMGGLMAMAVSKVGKAKSQIAQVTGSSASAGRLATGMLTYAEGNVNEFTDPSTLTPGRQYNVDGADGKTYRARYMGKGAKTHITTGPEFHLVGEAGREAIIDAKTTRQIQMDEPGIWQAIQTLHRGGRVSAPLRRRTGRGMSAYADGNMEEFSGSDDIAAYGTEGTGGGMSTEQMLAFQQSLDRNSAIMERLVDEGIEAFVSPYGKRGIVNGYDTYKKQAARHGEKYL